MSANSLTVGEPAFVKGDITTNTWVGARCARDLEASLGFGAGRLARGWWILVLKQRLTADDFIFSGLTIRSGGRLGLPADDPSTDRARQHVSAAMEAEYGATQVAAMRDNALKNAKYEGPERLVKVIPVTLHEDSARPSDQYPMGGGGLQWTLIRKCEFLVVAKVDESEIARTASFATFIGPSAGYDERARLARAIALA